MAGLKRSIAAAILVMMALLSSGRASLAVEVEIVGAPVRREILAVYDSAHEATPQTSRIHQFLEMPLNWLGFSVIYIDVHAALPESAALARYGGIVTWLVEPLSNAASYLTWLDGATGQGLRIAVFSDLAPATPLDGLAVAARIYARLGLQPTSDQVSVTHKVTLDIVDAAMVGFERPLDAALPDFRVLHAITPQPTVHLSVRLPGPADEPRPVLVATGAGGGYVSDEYAIAFDANTDRVRWTLNPFHFLKLALGVGMMPVPDVTTASGRRIYFSQIDGDGWNNVSLIEGYRQSQTLSADVVRRDAIEAFPDLPVTVGAIAGDLQPELGGSAAGREAARKLYALPQVEVGSHTYSHPFDWGFYANYSRVAEEALIDKAHASGSPFLSRARALAYAAVGRREPDDTIQRYVAGSSDLPRTYLKEPFDLTKEVAGALAFVAGVAPAGKKPALYQWSGNCLPFEAAIRATRQAGVRNMNGGDTRFDSEFPSVFYVSPISKPVGRERQIYSGNSNENTYTNDWTGPYYGYQLLAETVRNTETPRRLKPFNVYYHMYSGEREASLAALRANLTLARQSLLTPIAASHYAAMADDFFAVDLVKRDALTWTVGKRGALQTVRFDDAQSLAVDIDASRGVLGSTRHVGGALYVALDAAVEPAIVALVARAPESTPVASGTNATGEPPSGLTSPVLDVRPGGQLISARWLLRDYTLDGCGFGITAQGYGAGDMLWQTAANRKFDVIAERDGVEIARAATSADATGVLQLVLAVDAIAPLHLRFVCSG